MIKISRSTSAEVSKEVLVFGVHIGVVLPHGDLAPPDPEKYVHVAYRNATTGVLYQCFVLSEYITPRS